MIDIIIKHVANGGSALDLSKSWGVVYSDIMAAIRKNPDWKIKYDQALKDREEWSREAILREIRCLAHVDIRLIFDSHGGLLPLDQWPEETAKAVIGIESYQERMPSGESVGEVKKIKTESKLKALELLGKTQAMFQEKIQHSADESLAAVLAATINRPEK